MACVMRKCDKTSSSSSSICMIYAFQKGPVAYSLYLFNLSTVAKPLTPPPQPPRHNLLNFYRQYWPYRMGFAASPHNPHLLYVIGGIQSGNDGSYDDHLILSKKVYTLDLTQIKQQQNQRFIELPEISDMKVGTMNPITVWARRKLYVLAGKSKSNRPRNFEVFDPKSGEWTLLPEFEFNGRDDQYLGTAVVGHTIYFVSYDRVIYFNTKSNCWNQFADKFSSNWNRRVELDSPGSTLILRTFLRNNIDGAGVAVDGILYAIGKEDKLLCYDPHSCKIKLGAVRGLECRNGADLVHLGDSYFCLVYPEKELSFCGGDFYGDKTGGEEGLRFTTFRCVKSECATGKTFRWADILDSFIIKDFVSVPGYVVCSFAFPKFSS